MGEWTIHSVDIWDISSVFKQDETSVLHHCCNVNSLELVRFFVEITDIDVSTERWDGLLAFHQARDFNMVKYLIEQCGSNIYARSKVRS
jgi:hypothetical protein